MVKISIPFFVSGRRQRMTWWGTTLARTGDMENRQKRILNLLAYTPAASVAQLSAETGVTKETIRKDLTRLCDSGKITRIHGGAVLSDAMPFQVRKTIAEDEKIYCNSCV